MKTKIKKILKGFRPLLLSAVIVASSIAIPINEAHAATIPNGIGSAEISKIHKDLGDEAWAQLTWHILKKCVKGSYEERDTAFKPSEILTDDDFFDYARDIRGVVEVSTGYYLENKVQGNGGDDGAIYCRQGNNKILTIAADAAGIDYRQILCSNNSPGIMRNRNRTSECNPSSTADEYEFSPSYDSHLSSLWNTIKGQKGWATSWGDIGNYGGVNGYVLYGYEAGYRCGSSAGTYQTESEKPSGYYINPALKNVGQDAGKSYEYFTADNDIENEFVNRSDISNCSDLITRANSDTVITAFVEKVLVTFNDRCMNFYQGEIDANGDKISDEAKDQFNGLKNANQGTYPFLEDKDDPKDPTDTEDKQCVTIEGILHPEQTDDDSFADDSAADNETNEPNCYTKAGSLGWILCPLIDSLGTFILEKYEQWIVPALQMDVALFSDSSDSGTFQAWQIFRDIANVLFVILFLFVIFSQLTGIGIDNYGIKKILPKLIVGAILINLSYIICQLSIDIFNIIGRGIGSLFKGISDQLGTISSLQVDNVTAPSSAWESFTSSTWSNVLIIIVGALGVAAVLSQGLAIIVPVLLLFISIAFSVFTLVAILGIRQAAAVLLVAVSPLAFACYMLPNTKPIFDKWFNFFKGLLMAFPVCSALIYGGDMAGKILLTAAGQNTWVIISAAVVSVAPIFFIPKVITGSLGALSGAVAKFGGGLGRRAQGSLAHSGFAMDMNRRAQMQRAGIKFDKNGNAKYTARGRLQNLTHRTTGSKQRLTMARKQAAMAQAQMGGAGLMMGAGGLQRMSNMQKAAQAGQAEQDVKDIEASIGLTDEINNNDALSDGLYNAMMSGDSSRMKAYQNILYGKGEDGRDAARKAVEKAQGDGASKGIIQDYGSNAMNNWAKDLKSNARSDFEFAKAAASGDTSKSISSYRAIEKANKYTAESMATMDDSQVKSMIQDINSGAATEEQKQYAQQAAYEALHNDNISLKGERRKDLEAIAAGYTPSSDAASGGSGPAPSGDNGGGSGPAPSGGNGGGSNGGGSNGGGSNGGGSGPAPSGGNGGGSHSGGSNGGGGGAPSSGGSNPPAKPVVAQVDGKAGTVNIRQGDRPGEYQTDSGIILSGSTVDNINRSNSNGGGGDDDGSSHGGIIIAH